MTTVYDMVSAQWEESAVAVAAMAEEQCAAPYFERSCQLRLLEHDAASRVSDAPLPVHLVDIDRLLGQ